MTKVRAAPPSQKYSIEYLFNIATPLRFNLVILRVFLNLVAAFYLVNAICIRRLIARFLKKLSNELLFFFILIILLNYRLNSVSKNTMNPLTY